MHTVNNMADDKVVICNPLCFLLNRFGKTAVKHLKSALLDFYDVKDLSEAKNYLLDDVRKSVFSSDMPHIPERREGELRAVRTVDDIFDIVSFLDEKLLLGHLSKYVADSPDAMPATRLYEGDLAIVMKVMERMSGQIVEFDVKLAAILKDVQSLQHSVNTGVRTGSAAGGPDRRVVSGSQRARDTDHHCDLDRPTAGAAHTGDSSVSGAGMMSQVNNDVASDAPVSNWASAVAASSPAVFRNHRIAAETTDEERDGQFVEYRSRRSAKRARRASPQQQQHQPQQSQQPVDQSSAPRRLRGGRLMRGNAAPEVRGLAAAKRIVDKAVFCVDNVDPSVDVNQMKDFVASLSVNVVSCFAAEPRRRRGESGPITDRRAFRLCIAAADRSLLLDDRQWPHSVIISEWYYIAPSETRRQNATKPSNGGLSPISVAATFAPTCIANISPSISQRAQAEVAMDAISSGGNETIIYHDGASTASTST